MEFLRALKTYGKRACTQNVRKSTVHLKRSENVHDF